MIDFHAYVIFVQKIIDFLSKYIPLNERFFNQCNSNFGDEILSHFVRERKLSDPMFYKRPNILKFSDLMSTRPTTSLIMLSKFVDCIRKKSFERYYGCRFLQEL